MFEFGYPDNGCGNPGLVHQPRQRQLNVRQAALASHFGATDAFWSDGDFNYDGRVNLQDFNRLASNFGLSAAGPEVTPQDWAALAASIPEPGAGPLVGFLAILLRRCTSARRTGSTRLT